MFRDERLNWIYVGAPLFVERVLMVAEAAKA